MSCILRISGKNFDVDAFIKQSLLVAYSFWRKGERRFPDGAESSINKINDSSGIRILASEADFSELSKQIEETIVFLQNTHEEIKKITSLPTVEWATLDFGAEIHPPGWSSFTFPPELLSLAGFAGVSLCLSVYPIEN